MTRDESGSGPERVAAARSWAARAERAALIGMALGLALLLLPLGAWSFRAGFLVVLASTVAEIVFSHLRADER